MVGEDTGTIFGFAFLLVGALWGSLLMFSLKFGGGAVEVVPESAGPGPASLLEEGNFSTDGRSTASMICDTPREKWRKTERTIPHML